MKIGLNGLLIAALSMALFSDSALAELVTISFENPPGFYGPEPPVDPPGEDDHGPYDWLENGARYSGFWFNDVATLGGFSQRGHTHFIVNGYGGNLSDLQHSWQDGLVGAEITLENGGPFDVVSISYRLTWRDSGGTQFERLPWTIDVSDTHLALATSIDPVAADFGSFESQFSFVDIDDGSLFDLGGGNFDPLRPDASLTLQSIPITGFDNVTDFFIAHTGREVYIDNIVIDTLPLPEVPGPGLLLAPALVIAGAIGARRDRRAARRQPGLSRSARSGMPTPNGRHRQR